MRRGRIRGGIKRGGEERREKRESERERHQSGGVGCEAVRKLKRKGTRNTARTYRVVFKQLPDLLGDEEGRADDTGGEMDPAAVEGISKAGLEGREGGRDGGERGREGKKREGGNTKQTRRVRVRGSCVHVDTRVVVVSWCFVPECMNLRSLPLLPLPPSLPSLPPSVLPSRTCSRSDTTEGAWDERDRARGSISMVMVLFVYCTWKRLPAHEGGRWRRRRRRRGGRKEERGWENAPG